MTFEELDERFPNGFDDARLGLLSVNYADRSILLQLSLGTNSPEGPNSQEYTRANLILREFYYVSVEPPDADRFLNARRSMITIDGLPEDANNFPLFTLIRQSVPAGGFFCRFFVHDWNAFMHLAAKDAEFSVVQDEKAERGA